MEQEASFFGDYRLDQASRFIHDRLVSDGPDGISVRRLGGNRAGEVRLGRFLRNGKDDCPPSWLLQKRDYLERKEDDSQINSIYQQIGVELI